MLPSQVKVLEYNDFILLLESKRLKEKREEALLRHQTALIVEGFVGKGNGVKYVLGAWKLEGEEEQEITSEQLKALLKHKKEQDALRKLKNG